MAKAKTDEKIVVEEKVETKKVAPKQEAKRKIIKEDIEVEFINNTNGLFVYYDENTRKSYQLGEFGDADYITIGELRQMKNKHKGILSKFWILLVNVLDNEIELEDVIKYLNLEKEYENALSLEEVDSLLIDKSEGQFETVFNKLNEQFKQRVVERAVYLFDNGQFNDMYRASIMKDYAKDDELFKIKKED